MKLIDGITITHGIFFSNLSYVLNLSIVYNSTYIETAQILLSRKFKKLLERKAKEWNRERIEFSIGEYYQSETIIRSIAIVHPRDVFSTRVAEEIVVGRIRRQSGAMIPQRFPYNYSKDHKKPYPSFIEEEINN